MAPISILPTELLLLIFLTSLDLRVSSRRQIPTRFDRKTQDRFFQALSLTHVCRKWREIAAAFTDLWNDIYLTLNMCQNMKITGMILDRVDPLSSTLEIYCPPPIPARGLAGFFAAMEQAPTAVVQKALDTKIIGCCATLRVTGTAANIRAILHGQELVNRSHSLRNLECIMLNPDFRTTMDQPDRIDLALRNITSVRTNGFIFSNLPAGGMHTVILEDLELPSEAYTKLLTTSGVKRLVLRRVMIPQPAATQLSSGTQLEHLELESVQLTAPGGILCGYLSPLFIDPILSQSSKTLITLSLVEIQTDFLEGFYRWVNAVGTEPHLKMVCLRVSTITLDCGVLGTTPAKFFQYMQTIFPNTISLKLLGGDQHLRSNARLQWPSVSVE